MNDENHVINFSTEVNLFNFCHFSSEVIWITSNHLCYHSKNGCRVVGIWKIELRHKHPNFSLPSKFVWSWNKKHFFEQVLSQKISLIFHIWKSMLNGWYLVVEFGSICWMIMFSDYYFIPFICWFVRNQFHSPI